MESTAKMGEVEEMHSKEESDTEAIVLNGDVIDTKSPESEEIAADSTEEHETPMEVDFEEQGLDGSPSNHDQEQELDEGQDLDCQEVENQDGDSQDVDSQELDDSSVYSVEVINQCDDEEEEIQDHSDDEVHEIEDDDEVHHIEDDEMHEVEEDKPDDPVEDSDKNGINCDNTIELNDSGEPDVTIIDIPKENGKSHSDTNDKLENEDDDVITIDTPIKKDKEPLPILSPRRSSRNLNKQRSYTEDDVLEEQKKPASIEESSEESDIEEVLPQDPLAVGDVDKMSVKKTRTSSTIVVKDTKRLVEIASKTSPSTTGKKEPTLVIIDTNSILSGRGPIPITSKPSQPSYPVLPAAVPAQGVYPANMRATITPIPLTPRSVSSPKTVANPRNSSPKTTSAKAQASAQQTQQVPQAPQPPQPPILPSLTDDMFVVEAPSFIVPYVYEKPPLKDFKEFIKDMAEKLREQLRKEEEEEKKKKSESGKSESDEKDEESDTEGGEAKEKKKDDDDVVITSTSTEKPPETLEEMEKKANGYFESPLGKFFVEIGYNLVQEFVQTDLLKQQKRKRDREGGQNSNTNKTIQSLLKNLEYSKENNEPFRMEIKKCEFCSFKTESALAMAFHLETPHMKNYIYRCNFCPFEVRSPHDILFHMEAEHAVRGRLERAPAFHQCPNCLFEDNQKGKLSRHSIACARKFKPERNLEPPVDWEPPAKIPRVTKMKPSGFTTAAAMYQLNKNSQYQMMAKMQPANSALNRGRGRPTLTNVKNQLVRQSPGMVYKQMSGGSVLVPTNYQLSGNQLYQVIGQEMGGRIGTGGPMTFVPNLSAASSAVTFQPQSQQKKTAHQPSISITPLPRGTSTPPTAASKPGDSNSKSSFVICEICDGYIKDLEQLRNHMQWIHKVKIHPKMIYNRPPLNCQKCQFRFFTDQGLERHLLGSHGLVTSSMQEAANRSKDAGRCPVCGRVYQWKLLNHVARDHNMTLKPAHLSYKCTVCTATFGMYKQFENHVYSAHSVVAKRVMDKKSNNSQPSSKNDSLLKPLKINDEITIIPQLPKGASTSKEGSPSSTSTSSRNSLNGPSTSKKIHS